MTAPVWTPTTVTLGELRPWSENPRLMKKAQAKRLLDGWEALGQFQTIAVGPGGEVYDGHQRLSALLSVHGKGYQIAALRSDRPLTDDERRRLVFAANAPAGQWDSDKLASWDTAKVLDWAGVDAAQWGDIKRETAMWGEMLQAQEAEAGDADAEPQTDRAEELREKWGTELGQLWHIGPHRLLCGDSTRREDVERVMGGEMADMVFEDPPYNVAGECRNYAADAPTQKKTYEALKNSEWDKDFDIAPHLELLLDFMAEDCAVYVCTSHWLVQKIWEWMWEWSKFCSYCVWCKPNPAPSLAKRHWNFSTELIPYAVRGKHIANYPATGHALSWWEIVSPSHTEPHPTQKPLPIPNRAIEFSSNVGAIVFDGFAGSGTTLVACQNLGRVARAIELSPAYCAVILERMAQAFPALDIHKAE